MWRGKLRFTTAMLFSVGMVTMFTIGGLSGVTHAVAPADTQQHRHVLHRRPLPLRAVRRRLPGLHGRLLLLVAEGVRPPPQREARQGQLLGDARRLQPHVRPAAHPRAPGHAPPDLHLQAQLRLRPLEHGLHHRLVHPGLLGAAVPHQHPLQPPGEAHKPGAIPAGNDPWDARSLEWISTSPPPAHNFDVVPEITELDELWHRKYAEDERGRLVRVAAHRGRGRQGRRHQRAPAGAVVLAARAWPSASSSSATA